MAALRQSPFKLRKLVDYFELTLESFFGNCWPPSSLPLSMVLLTCRSFCALSSSRFGRESSARFLFFSFRSFDFFSFFVFFSFFSLDFRDCNFFTSSFMACICTGLLRIFCRADCSCRLIFTESIARNQSALSS